MSIPKEVSVTRNIHISTRRPRGVAAVHRMAAMVGSWREDSGGGLAHKIEALRGTRLFGGCSERTIRFVATQVDEIVLPARSVLSEQGIEPSTFFMLIEGQAEIRVGDRVTGRLGAGSVLDLAAMWDLAPASATITTTTPVRVLVMGRAQFRALRGIRQLRSAMEQRRPGLALSA